ncbi:MAG: hypothetical protein JXR97_03135 [Planctomycetes bacterium]|nr:hypothetical protein [Planctomycetota bacterium]
MIDRLVYLTIAMIFIFSCSLRSGEEEEKRVVIKTKNGGTIEGVIVKESSSWIKIKSTIGPLKINRVDILSMEEGITPRSQFKKLRQKVSDTDAQNLIKLGQWCEKNKLVDEARKTYMEACEIAGPHFLEARMLLGKLSMQQKDYRTAVICYSDLANRLKHEQAVEVLRMAEDKLREGRLSEWKKGKKFAEDKRYYEAISSYVSALDQTVKEEPDVPGDIGRTEIIDNIIKVRAEYVNSLGGKNTANDLIATDKPVISWVYRERPSNLRANSIDISMRDLRVYLDHYIGMWLAVKGEYNGKSKWTQPAATAVKLSADGHPEVAVVTYNSDARHRDMLARTKHAYLEELIAKYPYGTMSEQISALTPGTECVFYGRLRKRKTLVPQFVFEVWAIESVTDPDAAELAANLKKPLRCEFSETNLSTVLDFVTMVTQAEIEFESGEVPDITVNLSVSGKPAGYVVGQLAKSCGLKWTRKGKKVLMKRSLDEREEAMMKQVIILASDHAKR